VRALQAARARVGEGCGGPQGRHVFTRLHPNHLLCSIVRIILCCSAATRGRVRRQREIHEGANALGSSAGVPITLAAVDATVDRDLGEKFDVQGFPTIKIFEQGADKPSEYEGPRKADGVAPLYSCARSAACEDSAREPFSLNVRIRQCPRGAVKSCSCTVQTTGAHGLLRAQSRRYRVVSEEARRPGVQGGECPWTFPLSPCPLLLHHVYVFESVGAKRTRPSGDLRG